MQIAIQKLHPDAKLPAFAHKEDAGLDVFTIEEVLVKPGERVQVRTGIAMQIPTDFVGLVWDKSGISHLGGLKSLGGVIDSGFTGEILVGVVNLGKETYTFKKGAKIAQILIQRVEHPIFVEVKSLEKSDRGEKGFGSSDK